VSSLLGTLVFAGLLLGGLRSPWSYSLVAVSLWALAYNRPPAWKSVPARGLWLTWLAWLALSVAFSPEPWISLAAFAKTLTAFLVFTLACSAPRERTPQLVTTAVLAGAAALVLPQADPMLIGILQPYYNYTMALMAAAGAAAIAYALTRDCRREKIVLGLAALFALAVILAGQSRGGLAALLGGGAAALMLERRWKTLGALVIAAAAGIVLLSQIHPDTLKLNHPGAYTRPLLWRAAVQVAQDQPLLGEGPGRFEAGFLRHNVAVPPGIRLTRYPLRSAHAHSEFLQSAAESGWPALVFFLLALGATFLHAVRNREPGTRAALAACTALLLQALWDNIWALPALHWTFFLLLGTAAGRDEQSPEPRLRPALALGLALALGAWFPNWRIGQARAAAFTQQDGTAWMHKALALAPEDADLWADLARVELNAGRPRQALAALSEAEQRNPTDATLPLMAAEIVRNRAAGLERLQQTGERRSWALVRSLAERVLDLEPRCPQAQLLAAEAAYYQGRRKDAVFHLEAAAEDAPPATATYTGHTRIILHYDEERVAFIARLLRSR
jgi:O-antigen ligase